SIVSIKPLTNSHSSSSSAARTPSATSTSSIIGRACRGVHRKWRAPPRQAAPTRFVVSRPVLIRQSPSPADRPDCLRRVVVSVKDALVTRDESLPQRGEVSQPVQLGGGGQTQGPWCQERQVGW